MKYYMSKNQYFPMENLPQLEADASLLDISSTGRCSVSVKDLEFWKKTAHKLVASIRMQICSLQQLMSTTRDHDSPCPVQTLGNCG